MCGRNGFRVGCGAFLGLQENDLFYSLTMSTVSNFVKLSGTLLVETFVVQYQQSGNKNL